MALFKISKGTKTNLNNQTLTEGYCWFTPDDGKFYIDAKKNNTLTRIPLNGVNDVSSVWSAGTTAGPTISITVNDITSEAVAIPSASTTASGVVTTDNQSFSGRKTISLVNPTIFDGNNAASRYKHIYFNNNATSLVADIQYDSGDYTNVSSGQFSFMEYSPNSTASTTTTGYYERYKLPTVTTGLTDNKVYSILTSKTPVSIAQGGTDATTAQQGIWNLLSGLPAWTANPKDDTYFIRQDTGGSDTYGKAPFSTVYNYIKGKTDSLYLPLSGGTVTGTLVLSKTQDASGTSNYSPALIVGGVATGSHIEIDSNEILAKSDGTTPTTLYLQDGTGTVNVSGSGGLTVASTTDSSSTTTGALRVNGGIGCKGSLNTGNNITATKAGAVQIKSTNSDTGVTLSLNNATNQGLYSSGYYTGSAYTSSAKWIIYRNSSGKTIVPYDMNGNFVLTDTGRRLFVSNSASVPSGAVAGDIVLVKA